MICTHTKEPEHPALRPRAPFTWPSVGEGKRRSDCHIIPSEQSGVSYFSARHIAGHGSPSIDNTTFLLPAIGTTPTATACCPNRYPQNPTHACIRPYHTGHDFTLDIPTTFFFLFSFLSFAFPSRASRVAIEMSQDTETWQAPAKTTLAIK